MIAAANRRRSILNALPSEFLAQYVILAGGGGGSTVYGARAGRGGAGGFRSSLTGLNSGGGAGTEATITLSRGVNYTLTVGAGSPANTQGISSVFSDVISIGGGSNSTGGSGAGGNATVNHHGDATGTGYAGTAGQGYRGGNWAVNHHGDLYGGGGGGAAGVGGNGGGAGAGITTDLITGSSALFAEGGSAGTGSANSGKGGGIGLNGGSGIVMLKVPLLYSPTVSAGIVYSQSDFGDGVHRRILFTAGTGTVTF